MYEPEIRLSVKSLRELIERAPSECYMIVQDQHGNWARVTPYGPEDEKEQEGEMSLPSIVGEALTLVEQYEDDAAKYGNEDATYDEMLAQYESDAFDLVRRIANAARKNRS